MAKTLGLSGANWECDRSFRFVRFVNRGEHFHNGAAIFSTHQRFLAGGNRLQKFLDLAAMIFCHRINLFKPRAIFGMSSGAIAPASGKTAS